MTPATKLVAKAAPGTDAKLAFRAASTARLEAFLSSDATLELPATDAPDVSVLLILHNQAELTFACLSSIRECLQTSAVRTEVVIVDNASGDATGALLERTRGARMARSRENLHFLKGANRAAAMARGRSLLFLNNDALLFHGSLERALETLESDERIGAVGARIILPGGVLQEAGSIIWRDGSCAGYARGAPPTAPVAMFRRDVDFCSGAFLLTRRALFEALGGFDEHYAPAYYEETDYCVRLWEAGYRVVYEPDCAIMHYEFGSGAQDRAVALQQHNQALFRERRRAWLEHQPAPEVGQLAARTRRIDGAPRILMIEDHVPHEALGSGYPRSNALLRELAARSRVTLLPTVQREERWSEIRRSVPAEVEVALDHSRASLGAFLRERRGLFDAIVVCRPHNMAALLAAGGGTEPVTGHAELIYDAEAVFSVRDALRRQVLGEPAIPAAFNLADEIALAQRASQVISVSVTEKRLFEDAGVRRVRLLGHCFTPDPTAADFADRRDLLFVGAVHEETSPNADSLRWFVGEILPRLRQRLGPAVRLKVVGLNRACTVAKLGGRGLELVGPANDLRPHFETARVFVAPTRFAAGIAHKVGQAAAFGVPVAATDLIASQLGWASGREILTASTAAAFADACASLYEDAALWARVREAALRRIEVDGSTAQFSETVGAIVSEIGRGARSGLADGWL